MHYRTIFALFLILLLSYHSQSAFALNIKQEEKIAPSATSQVSAKTRLIGEDEIKATTFVDLDFKAFPQLPEVQISSPSVINVSKNGNDERGDGSYQRPFASISHALRTAKAGQTVVIREGVYQEVFEEGDYRGLVITQNNLTMMGMPDETVEIRPKEGVTYGVVIQADKVQIQGLQLNGFSTVGILAEGDLRQNLVLNDVVISGSSEGFATWDGTIKNLLLFNVRINASGIGIHCGNGKAFNWRLENTRVAIAGKSEGSGADAFAIEDGDNILIVNSSFSGASADGIDTKASRVVVYGCEVHNVQRNGIKLWQGGDIINSLVHHTGADASIVVEEGSKTRLLNSVIAYHNYDLGESYSMTFGYDSQFPMQVEIINSIIFNNSGGMYFNPGSKVQIRNTLFHGIQNNLILEQNEKAISLADGPNALKNYGDNILFQDPGLDDFFYPSDNSSIIDRGLRLDQAFPSKDKNGNPRIHGPNPDLGPFEKQD